MSFINDGIFQKERGNLEKLAEMNQSNPMPRPIKEKNEVLSNWEKKIVDKNANGMKPYRKMFITGKIVLGTIQKILNFQKNWKTYDFWKNQKRSIQIL